MYGENHNPGPVRPKVAADTRSTAQCMVTRQSVVVTKHKDVSGVSGNSTRPRAQTPRVLAGVTVGTTATKDNKVPYLPRCATARLVATLWNEPFRPL